MKLDLANSAAGGQSGRWLRCLAPATFFDAMDELLRAPQRDTAAAAALLRSAHDGVERLLAALLALHGRESAPLERQLRRIEELANAQAGGAGEESARFTILRDAGLRIYLQFEHVCAGLMSTNMLADLRRYNPFLADEHYEQLLRLLLVVLCRSSRLGQLNRAIARARDLAAELALFDRRLHAASATASALLGTLKLVRTAARSLVSEVFAGRSYMQARDSDDGGCAVTFDPRLLVFEFTSGYLLRRRQVELIEKMRGSCAQRQSVVHQMIMGAGKTSVIGPVLAMLLADGNTAVTMVVPGALFAQSMAIMHEIFAHIIAKPVYTLEFDRSSSFADDPKALERLFWKLHTARKEGGFVVTTPESVKSLFLKYLDLLHSVDAADELLYLPRDDYPKDSAAALGKMAAALQRHELAADVLGKILAMWKSEGTVIVDEVDTVLHPLKSETNFPVGQKQELPLSPARWQLVGHLLDGLFFGVHRRVTAADMHISDAGLAALARIEDALAAGVAACALQRTPHLLLLEPRYYEQQLREPMAAWALQWLLARKSIGKGAGQLSTALDAAGVEALLLRYLTRAAVDDDDGRLIRASFSRRGIQLLNLTRDWVASFLPHCLGKANRVSYGLLQPRDLRWLDAAAVPLTRRLLAVPFLGKDVPSNASEFAHPEILIGLTLLAYRYEGMRLSDCQSFFREQKRQLNAEVGPYVERPSRVRFDDWLQLAVADEPALRSRSVLPLELLQPDDPAQLDELAAVLCRLPEAVGAYLDGQVFPDVLRYQSVKLQASGYDLGSDMLFACRVGFSGTPEDLVPRSLACHFEPGDDAQILRTLSDPAVVSFASFDHSWSVDQLLLRIATAAPPYSALIDAGALITGKTNEQVARYLLQHGLDGYDACVFLDETNQKMVVDRSGDAPIPLNRSGVRLDQRFTFYDQVHTTGTDIPQSIEARAVVTVSKDMTLRDFAQGCWRMRGLQSGQTVTVYLVREIDHLVASYAAARQLPPDDRNAALIGWLMANSIQSDQLQAIQLCHQEIAHLWRHKAYRRLLDSKAVSSLAPFRSRFAPVLSAQRLDDIRTAHNIVVKPPTSSASSAAAAAASSSNAQSGSMTIGTPEQLAALPDDHPLKIFNSLIDQLGGANMDPQLKLIINQTFVRYGFSLETITALSEILRSVIRDTQPPPAEEPEDDPELAMAIAMSKEESHDDIDLQRALQMSTEPQTSSSSTDPPSSTHSPSTDPSSTHSPSTHSPSTHSPSADPPSIDPTGPMCPKGHAMVVSTFSASPEYSTGLWCNVCKTRAEAGSARWFCQICEYDVCFKCAPAPSAAPSGGDDFDERQLIEGGAELAACIDVYREPLGHTIESTVVRNQTYHEQLRPLLQQRQRFLAGSEDELAQFLAQLHELGAAAEDTSDTLKDLNQEMVQEQEQQQEQQKKKVRQQEQNRKFGQGDTGGNRWPLAKLIDSDDDAGGEALQGVFFPLADFQFEQNTPPLPFPSRLLLSENHTPKFSPSQFPRCLKDVHVAAVWLPADGKLRVGVVTLQEAESLRHAVFHQPALAGRLFVVTLTARWLTARPPARQSRGLPLHCLRFFNNDTSLTMSDTIQLLQIFKSVPQSKRRTFFESTLMGRRRTRVSWLGTQVARVFSYPDELGLIALQALIARIKAGFKQRYASLVEAFRAMDANHDGWLSPDELTAGLAALDVRLAHDELDTLLGHISSDDRTAAAASFIKLQTFVAFFADEAATPLLAPSADVAAASSDAARSSESIAPGSPSSSSTTTTTTTTTSLAAGFVQGLRLIAGKDTSSTATSSSTTTGVGQALPTSSLSLHVRVKTLKSLGRLALVGGGAANFSTDGVVSTSCGQLPSVGFQGVSLNRGRYYYEVTIIRPGRGCIGWADMLYRGASSTARGVGDDLHSWGLNSRGVLRHSRQTALTTSKLPWSAGDVVCCALDLKTNTIRFALNGDWSPQHVVSAEHISFSTAIAPMVSLECELVFQMNSGAVPFRYDMPHGFRSVHYWVRRRMREIYVTEAGPRLGTLVAQGLSREVLIDKWRVAPNLEAITSARGTVFPSIRLDGVLLTDGRWYYEVTVKDCGVAQLGWIDLDFWASSKEGVGVGDDKSSWAYDGARCVKWFQVSVRWGLEQPWSAEEVVGVACDVTERSVRFSRNGSWSPPMGLAFANINFSGGLTPALTLQGHPEQSFSCELNFGDDLVARPFVHRPPGDGYSPVWDAVVEGKELLLSMEQRSALMSSTAGDLFGSSTGAAVQSPLTASLETRPLWAIDRLGVTVTSGYSYVMIADDVVTASEHYPSLIGSRIAVYRGRWYYEIEVLNVAEADLPRDPLFSVGWAKKGYFGDAIGRHGVGDDHYSWGVDNLARVRQADRVSDAAAPPIKRRDVVGCMAEPMAQRLTFFRNGDILTVVRMAEPAKLTPAFSLRNAPKGTVTALRFNFGHQPFAYPPAFDGVLPIDRYLKQLSSSTSSSPVRPVAQLPVYRNE